MKVERVPLDRDVTASGRIQRSPALHGPEAELGDRLLFCSDGASGVLNDGRLADILSMSTPDYAAVELVRASLESGSSDNVTCIVADVLDVLHPASST